jgi:hypothetical protein
MCINQKISVFSIVFLCLLSRLFAQEEWVGAVDEAVKSRDSEQITSILGEYTMEGNYGDVEAYVFGKAEEMILKDEYEFAQKMLEAILLNNLENFAAQELYTTLDITIREKKAEEEARLKAEEEAKRLAEVEAKVKAEEEARLKAEEEEQRKKEEVERKKAEEEAARVWEEKARKQKEEEERRLYYERVNNITLDHFSAHADIGAADFLLYYSKVYSDYAGSGGTHFKYGLSADISGTFNHPYIIADLEAGFDIFFLNLNPSLALPLSYSIVLSAGTPLIKFPVYLRGGFKHSMFLYGEDEDSEVLVTALISPVAGVGFMDLRLGNRVKLGVTADLYFSPFVSEYTDAAFDTSLETSVLFFEKGQLSLSAVAHLSSLFVFTGGGLENSSKLELGIGVGLNEE